MIFFSVLVSLLLHAPTTLAADLNRCAASLLHFGMLKSKLNRESTSAILKRFWELYKNEPAFSQWLQNSHQGLVGNFTNERQASEWISQFERLELSAKKSLKAQGKVVDLGSASLHSTSEMYEPLIKGRWLREPVTLYEHQVLHLIRGDTVQFGERKFKLGAFISAGNTTHLWEIEGRPDVLLRIPFLTQEVKSREKEKSYKERLQFWNRHTDKQVPLLPEGVKRVEIIESGPNAEYSVVKRVVPGEDGYSFTKYDPVAKLFKNYNILTEEKKNEIVMNTGVPRNEVEKIFRKYQSLWNLVHLMRDRGLHESANPEQFLWHAELNDWVLADW